jgi:hypothetical protein
MKKAVSGGIAFDTGIDSDALSHDDDSGDTSSLGAENAPDAKEAKAYLGVIEQLARIAASLGVAGAAIFGVIEYIASNEDIRRERSLSFVESWQDDGMIERYTRLQGFVEQRLHASELPPPTLPQDALARAYQNLGYAWVLNLRAVPGPESVLTETDIDRLTLFFSQMEICVASDLCNARVLAAYFTTEVTSFWQYFQGYARLRREANYTNYGIHVTALVARFGSLGSE